MTEAITAAIAKKELPVRWSPERCVTCCRSKATAATAPPTGLPISMFFYSDTDPVIWGANLPGFPRPVVGISDPVEHLTQFVIPVERWPDGTESL